MMEATTAADKNSFIAIPVDTKSAWSGWRGKSLPFTDLSMNETRLICAPRGCLSAAAMQQLQVRSGHRIPDEIAAKLMATNGGATFQQAAVSNHRATPESIGNPYLSIVAVSRNDNHGGDLKRRMQAFVDGLIYQCNRTRLNCELIIVDWNPPSERPALINALAFDQLGETLSVRIVSVSNDYHAQLRHADALPLYQMIAKNIGIRRSTAPFVLATNIDILFSDALFDRLSGCNLQTNCFYRSNRLDLPPDIVENRSASEMIRDAPTKVHRINGRLGSCSPPQYNEAPFSLPSDPTSLPALHLNACGDFQMMHRSVWEAIGGYAEFDGFSMHIDSLASYSAWFAGAREITFNASECHYHIDHADGWSPEGEATGLFRTMLQERRLPTLELDELIGLACVMNFGAAALQFNRPDWGMKNHLLDEVSITHKTKNHVVETTAFSAQAPILAQDYDPFSTSQEVRFNDIRDSRSLLIDKTRELLIGCIQPQRISNLPIYIWGAGERGTCIAQILQGEGVSLSGYIDGLASRPSEKNGLPVWTSEDVDLTSGALFIFVATMFAETVSNHLATHDLIPGVDFVVTP